jgi:hypothetical protein
MSGMPDWIYNSICRLLAASINFITVTLISR